MNAELKHTELTEKLINVYYSLYNELGYGFLESASQKAFALILTDRGLSYQQQTPIRVTFHGVDMGEFPSDLLVESAVLIELKAVRALEQAHERHLLNYLRATDIEVGLLFNFGPRPQFRRLAFDNKNKNRRARTAAGIIQALGKKHDADCADGTRILRGESRTSSARFAWVNRTLSRILTKSPKNPEDAQS